jgi:hypothetical protein
MLHFKQFYRSEMLCVSLLTRNFLFEFCESNESQILFILYEVIIFHGNCTLITTPTNCLEIKTSVHNNIFFLNNYFPALEKLGGLEIYSTFILYIRG